MRKVLNEQLKLGEVEISKLVFDPKSRDEIPQLLRGLQYIYCNRELKDKVFALLEEHIKFSSTGRPGMELWKILVMGTLRLNCNWNYDNLKEMVDQHAGIREMLGHVRWTDPVTYPMQTLKDNVSLLTPELLMQINDIVVAAGHNLVKKNAGELRARCDSFVVETNVHFPTDINLLFDAVRKSVELTVRFCDECGISGWRQADFLLKKMRSQKHHCERLKHSTSKDPRKQYKKEQGIKDAHAEYLKQGIKLIDRVTETTKRALSQSAVTIMEAAQIVEIDRFVADSRHQINLVERRVLKGEIIPHKDKIFSLFETHTEWICKGKAGTPQELGLRVGIVEDHYGYILTHMVMEKAVDSTVAEALISDAKKRFPKLYSCSTDKGYWSPENQEKLKTVLPVSAILKKGRLSQIDRERQESAEFKKAHKKHQAVESAINALENHGLDYCPDRGIKGFKRYVALAVTARNLQKLGAELQKQELARLKHSQAIKAGIKRKKESVQAA